MKDLANAPRARIGRKCASPLLSKPIIIGCALVGLSSVRGETLGPSNDQTNQPAASQSWKDRLADRGVTVSVEWDTDAFANPRGGLQRRAETDGLIKLSLDLDGDKLTWLPFVDDIDIHATGYYPYGTNISSYVRDLAGVNNNAAYNSPRLYELWAQKVFVVGGVNCSLRAGLLGADQEFDVNATASSFVNSSFGAPLGLAGNAPVPVYPFTALAIRAAFSAGDERYLKATFRSGAFDGNSAAPTLGPFAVGAPASPSYNQHGVDFHLNPRTGLIFFNELAFDFLGGAASGTAEGGHGQWSFGPGHCSIGGFYATDQFKDVFQAQLQSLGALEAPAGVKKMRGDYGVYLIGEQRFYQAAPGSLPDGLFLFGRGLVRPSDRNFDTVSAEIGAVYRGVFRQQAELHDLLGLGLAYNRISGQVRRAAAAARQERVPEVPNFEYESVLEATYVFPLTNHWQLQPDLQWVMRPGAAGLFGNALVFGLRSTLAF